MQVASLGKLPQPRFVALAKPLTEVTVMATVAGVPALNEPLDGARKMEKLGGPGHTANARAEDVEDALLESPP